MALVSFIVATVCLAVAALMGFGAIGPRHYDGWLALGLALTAFGFVAGNLGSLLGLGART